QVRRWVLRRSRARQLLPRCARAERSPLYYEVSVRTTAESPTAVVAQATTWEEFPALWRSLLDEVYGFLRRGGATQSGHNVMLFRDDVPNVEVGVQVAGTFDPSGRAVPSALPAGGSEGGG